MMRAYGEVPTTAPASPAGPPSGGIVVGEKPAGWTPVHTVAAVAGAAGFAWLVFSKHPWQDVQTIRTRTFGDLELRSGPEPESKSVSLKTMGLIFAGFGALFYVGYKLSPSGGQLTPAGQKAVDFGKRLLGMKSEAPRAP